MSVIVPILSATCTPFLHIYPFRKSSVYGNSGFGTAGGGFILTGVWP